MPVIIKASNIFYNMIKIKYEILDSVENLCLNFCITESKQSNGMDPYKTRHRIS